MLRWSFTVLLLVGAALAESQNGWKSGKEYSYKIKSRTLASFSSLSRQFSGIVMEGQLQIQSSGPETLRAKVSQAEYSPIHTRLGDGWESEIPRDQMDMKSMPLSDKPFEIKMKRGVVKDLIVDKNLPTWEVNILKSIVGQLQVDTEGENSEKSKDNQFPEGKQPYAVYKTMEDSVGGNCEVLYNISPLAERILQSKPESVPMPELRDDGEFISIVKTKNYSNCDQRVGYHFGVNGRNDWELGSNQNGKYLSRLSVSRIVISGDVKKYTIQSSATTNEVVTNPGQRDDQQAMILSKTELKLHKFKDIENQMSAPSNPKSIGNLVYDYNNPSNKESPRQTRHSKSHERNKKNKEHWRDNDGSYEISSDRSSEEENRETQPEPSMTEPPHNPMLPFFIGNEGHSIRRNNKVDVVKSAKSLAQEIGSVMVHYDKMPEEDTLEQFTILSKLVRLMNAEEIGEVERKLYQPPRPSSESGSPSQEQKARRNTWAVFRDAVANAGTGPALLNIKKWVQEEKIKDDEAAKVIDSIAKSTRTPTPEYMSTFLEMLKMKEVIEPPVVWDNAHQSFAELIRHAVVNKKSAHNRYPVHAFGKFYGKNIHFLHSKYFPYMASELQDGFDRKDSIKIQVITNAIGRTGHPRMLSLFEPYIEGKKVATPYQRFFMVLSMYRMTSVYPKTARSVLYKIYSNTEDHYEIRTAAVYLLMNTNPPASMLQRMAEFTNYDSSKQVNSAVKSSIESLAELHENENRELVDAATAALPLLTQEIYGPQYSRAVFKYRNDPISHTGYSLEAYVIGSDDSIIPKGFAFSMSPVQNGLKMPKIEMAGAVSKVQDLWDALQKQLCKKTKNNEKSEQKKYSPENIAKMLGINGEDPQLLEGFISVSDATNTMLFSYSDKPTSDAGKQLDNLLVDLPEKLRRLQKNLSKGIHFDDTIITNEEITISFPTETGYPLTFAHKVPKLLKIIGQSKAQIESDDENQSPVPKSATLTAKVHVIQGMKVQKRLSFVTPFEHRQYISGVDKNVQLHMPFKAEIEYNKDKKEASLKIQPNNEEPQFKMVQMKIEPFTSKHDIMSLKPVSTDANTLIIDKDTTQTLHVESKDSKQTMQFNWAMAENMFVSGDHSALKEQMGMLAMTKMARAVGSMYSIMPQEDTEYQAYSVALSPDSNMSLEMKISYDDLVKDSNKNDQDSSNEQNDKPKGKAPRLDRNMSQSERKQKLLNDATKNIESAEAAAVDVSFKINGDLHTSAIFTVAIAKSNIDEKARSLVYASLESPILEDYFFAAGIESKSPNFRTMDFEETLKANTQHEFDGEMKYGKKSEEKDAEIMNLSGKLKQTEGRKNQIRQSRQAQECMKEANRSGNKLTAACQKANDRAVTINAGEFNITFEDRSLLKELTLSALIQAETLALAHAGARYNVREKGEKNNKMKFSFEVSPNDESTDFTVETPDGKVLMTNIKMPHTTRSDFEDDNTDSKYESYENVMVPYTTCALDKSQVKTFDNYRYQMHLGQCWHVAMTPFPKNDYFRPGHHKEIPENKHVTVMTRDNQDGHKELKITIGEKEIELSSRGDRKVEAKVDGEKVKLMKKHGYHENKNGEIVLEIFELPDKSMKVLSEKYEVEITYDGSRALIKAGDKYRDSVRGLCGDNDGESENDQKTPKGCLLENPAEFIATYALINDEQCQGPARKNAEKAKQSECVDDKAHAGNVISDKEAGRKRHSSSSSSEESDVSGEDARCTKRRTIVSKSDDQICFSVKPVLSCMSGCHSTGNKDKNVSFHCVRRSSTSEKIAKRVEKGANPDLTQKKVSKIESHSIPISCKA